MDPLKSTVRPHGHHVSLFRDLLDLIKNLKTSSGTHITHLSSSDSSSMSCRTMVGGANLEMGEGTEGATLAMEVLYF